MGMSAFPEIYARARGCLLTCLKYAHEYEGISPHARAYISGGKALVPVL